MKKHERDKEPATLPEKVVELVVTEEDYQEGLKRGWTDEDMLRPGRYRLARGTFHKRHPGLLAELEKKKRA
jgi:hypothetical protein